jgi:hypothetical protein
MNTITHRPVRTDITMKEKEAVLRNDLRANTFAGRAQAEADDVRGRWAEINKSNVVGATPTPQYPAGPNWSVDPTGVEPPLGIDVNAVEPCGEKFEIEEFGDPATGSHQPAPPRHDERGSVGPPLGAAADAPSEVPASSSDVLSAPQSPTPNPKPTETR